MNEKVLSDIDLALKEFGTNIREKETEAEQNAKKIFSKRTYICSRCGKRIDPNEFLGKCIYNACENPICGTCWLSGKRFCKSHFETLTKKYQTGVMENLKDVIKNYPEILEKRFRELGFPDWTPNEYFKNVKMKVEKSRIQTRFIFYKTKFLLWKKTKIQIIIKPLTNKDAESEINFIKNVFGEESPFTMALFISKNVDKTTMEIFENFSDNKFYVFLQDVATGKVFFNKNMKPAPYLYSWLSIDQKPKMFMDIISEFSERISGRKVISVKDLAERLGIGEKNAEKLLKNCDFLEHIERTDSFILKERV